MVCVLDHGRAKIPLSDATASPQDLETQQGHHWSDCLQHWAVTRRHLLDQVSLLYHARLNKVFWFVVRIVVVNMAVITA